MIMSTTLAGNAAPANYPLPIAVAYARAAERGDLKAESLHQLIYGRTQIVKRLALLVEELVATGNVGDAQLLIDPILAALDGKVQEDFYQVLPIAESADASEDCSQTVFLIAKTPETLKRFLSENDDQITKSIRLRRAGYALLEQMKGDA